MAFQSLSAQDTNDVRIGKQEISKTGGHYFNYAEADKVNIEVSLWGYIPSPGKYLVPQGTTLIDLITLGGGPTQDSKLDDIRLIRMRNDSLNITQDKIIKVDYNDLLWEDNIGSSSKKNPLLMPGDIILIPGEPRYFFRENIGLILSVTSVLISLGILVLNIVRN
jgi:hypothetical protein